MMLTVDKLNTSGFDAWDAAVADSAGGSSYSTSAYLNALSRVTDCRFQLIAVSDGTQIVGGIGLFVQGSETRPVVRGRYLFYYNGPFIRDLPGASAAANEAHSRRVLDALEEYLRCSEFVEVQVKGRHPVSDVRGFIARGWRVRPVYSYEVDISDLDACLSRMHRNVRRQLRQAESEHVRVRKSADIDTFFGLHSETARRKGFPTYLQQGPMKSWFDELQGAGLLRLYLASQNDGAALAGLLVLAGGHPVTHSLAAASAVGKLPNGTNAFLRWKAFEDLSSGGFTANDLTDAHEPAVAKFKSQLGGNLVLSHELRLPATPGDYFRSAIGLATRNVKRTVKALIRQGASA